MKRERFFARCRNGMKIMDGQTLEVLAKVCGLSIWQFEKMYYR